MLVEKIGAVQDLIAVMAEVVKEVRAKGLISENLKILDSTRSMQEDCES